MGRGWGPARKFFELVVLPYKGNDCLIWPFARLQGHARMNIGARNRVVASLICERLHGPKPPSPPKHIAIHSCNGGSGANGCVTPRHVGWGTHSINNSHRRKK